MAHKKLLMLITSVSVTTLTLNAYVEPYCATPPHLTPRSQGEHIERLNAGLSTYLTKAATESNYGCVSIAPAFSRSFNPTALAATLFGDFLQTNRSLIIAGTNANPAANDSTDLWAKWFYLPDTYRGTMYFSPRIQNFTTDFDFYYGLDSWVEGLFTRVNLTAVHSKWDLGLTSVVEQVGPLAEDSITYLDDQLDYFCHEKTFTVPVTVAPLSYARICPCACTENGVADIHADLGWKFLIDDNFHLGLILRTVIPTGTRTNGKLLFAPVIGNGHHWELGGGLTSSYLIWHNEEREDRLGFYIDLYITHLFKTKECRVFDLKNKPLSRYMIGTKIENDASTSFAPIANISASRVNVTVNAQADLALWFDYTHKNMTADFGYNLWARSCEKVSCPKTCEACGSCCPNVIAREDNWGIFNFNGGAELTASNATIASSGTPDITPVYLSTADFDYRGGATRGMSHSFFGHIAYNWFDKINVPFIGLGGSVECARSSGCKPTSSCDTSCTTYHAQSCAPCCRNVALSQWSIWIKGGVAF